MHRIRAVLIAGFIATIFTAGLAEARPAQDHCVTRVCKKQAKRAHRAHVSYLRASRKLRALRAYDGHRIAVTAPYRGWLASTRACESGSSGSYRANTGNGFFGAYQFTFSTWRSVGGQGWPHQAEPLEQDYRAVLALKAQGPGAWPVCG
jgi:hypothetical protein